MKRTRSTLSLLALAGLCTLAAPAAAQTLTQQEVTDIVRRAIARANALGFNATISVVDQEGNVLCCVRMTTGVAGNARTAPNLSVVTDIGNGGLEGALSNGLTFPADAVAAGVPPTPYPILPPGRGVAVATTLTATTKAGTAAFLSTAGNAFTTRTAAFIVQKNFPPRTRLQGSGPLYGVQFSSLPISDLNRLPLGLSADSGGLPLYKVGPDNIVRCVGGIGVECNDTPTAAFGSYRVDTIKAFGTPTTEELIALAGQSGFTPPANIRADKIFVNGIRFPYAYASAPALSAAPATPDLTVTSADVQVIIPPAAQNPTMFITTGLVNPITNAVYDFYPEQAGIQNGETFPGFADVTDPQNPVLQTFDGVANGGQNLTATDVQVILANAHATCNRLRAMIRRDRPLRCQVNISVVDFDGNIIGFYRSPDAPVFGSDVSAQKARSALFFSRADCGAILSALEADGTTFQPILFDADGPGTGNGPYQKYRTANAALGLNLDGTVAIAERTIGFIGRENIPDGIPAFRGQPTPTGSLTAFGPLPAAPFPGNSYTQPNNRFSPFNTGIQTDLFVSNLVTFLLVYGPGDHTSTVEATSLAAFGVARMGNRPFSTALSPLGTADAGNVVPGRATVGAPQVAPPNGLPNRTLANGLQIFPGGVPLYKNGVLVGGIGISGDGIEQDDTIAFAGAGGFLQGAAGQDFQQLGTVNRADTFVITQPPGFSSRGFLRLPYIKIPRAPFQGL
jgi:uncharacterized protein GlcG (DUF336 family)